MSSPRWNALSTLFHLSARLAFLGMKVRSKASWRPTLPTIFDTSTTLRPKPRRLCARCPSLISSKASSRLHSRRKRAAMRQEGPTPGTFEVRLDLYLNVHETDHRSATPFLPP